MNGGDVCEDVCCSIVCLVCRRLEGEGVDGSGSGSLYRCGYCRACFLMAGSSDTGWVRLGPRRKERGEFGGDVMMW